MLCVYIYILKTRSQQAAEPVARNMQAVDSILCKP